jgi:hypothetical protein
MNTPRGPLTRHPVGVWKDLPPKILKGLPISIGGPFIVYEPAKRGMTTAAPSLHKF